VAVCSSGVPCNKDQAVGVLCALRTLKYGEVHHLSLGIKHQEACFYSWSVSKIAKQWERRLVALLVRLKKSAERVPSCTSVATFALLMMVHENLP
jgi:hypothetical protein